MASELRFLPTLNEEIHLHKYIYICLFGTYALKLRATQAHGRPMGKLHKHLSTNCPPGTEQKPCPQFQNPNFWKLKFSLSKQSDLDWREALTINIFALTPSHHILPHVNGQ